MKGRRYFKGKQQEIWKQQYSSKQEIAISVKFVCKV
jgi:hypothetical protein